MANGHLANDRDSFSTGRDKKYQHLYLFIPFIFHSHSVDTVRVDFLRNKNKRKKENIWDQNLPTWHNVVMHHSTYSFQYKMECGEGAEVLVVSVLEHIVEVFFSAKRVFVFQ